MRRTYIRGIYYIIYIINPNPCRHPRRTVKLIDFGLATRFYGYLPQDQYIEIVGAQMWPPDTCSS